MNKIYITFGLLIGLNFGIHAQDKIDDVTTDLGIIEELSCDSITQTVAEATAGGKALLVIGSGFDCSICRNEAPGLATFTDNNLEDITVWGAMHNRFSSNTPSCASLESWRTSYSWDNVYMFIDNNQESSKFWANSYTYYTVIGPDNTLEYYGGSQSTALAKAQEVTNITALEDGRDQNAVGLYYQDNQVTFTETISQFSIYNTSGKLVHQSSESSDQFALNLDTGIYITHFSLNGIVYKQKMVIND